MKLRNLVQAFSFGFWGVNKGGGMEQIQLTEKQLLALTMLANGVPLKLIARRMAISRKTLRYHINGAAERLGARGREQAVAKAVKACLIVVE